MRASKVLLLTPFLTAFLAQSAFTQTSNPIASPTPVSVEIPGLFPDDVTPLPQAVLDARKRAGYSIGTLTQFLDKNPSIQSIDQLIPLLPDTYRQNVTFVPKSKSLQGSSYDFPRVIAYGAPLADPQPFFNPSNDYLTITFKGNPTVESVSHSTADDLEMVDFNTQSNAFEFYALHFEPNGKSNYKIVGPNPPLCMTCHQGMQKDKADPRPNWSRYPIWPGVYGSRDFLRTDPNDSKYSLDDVAESAGWNHFYVTQLKTGRYQSLSLNQDNIYQSNADNNYMPGTYTNIPVDNKFDYLNAKRVSRMLHETPDYEKYRFAIYAALRNCPNLPSFLPANFPKAMAMNFDGLLADTQAKLNSVIDTKSDIGTYQATRITNLRYLFENRSFSIDPWFTNFGVNTYHETGQGQPDSNVPTIFEFEKSIKSDPELSQFIATPTTDYDYTTSVSTVNCDGLRQKSLAALQQ